MTAYVAVSSLDTPPLRLHATVDVMSATVEAARVIQLPAVSDQDLRGTTFELKWWLAEDGTGKVAIDRLTPSGRKRVRERVETFTVRANVEEVPFEVTPRVVRYGAQKSVVAASGAFWTDGSATVTDSDGKTVRLATRESLTRFSIAAAKAGFIIRKVSA